MVNLFKNHVKSPHNLLKIVNFLFNIVNMKLETELYKIMHQESLTNAKLAAKLGVSPSMLCLVLTGNKKPGRKFLQGLAVHYPDMCLKYLQSHMPTKTQAG